ncbi:MAG TPA: putative sulfate exporter family transporter [Gemmatimonadaceae bacterium]|jgi:uncharacterized integral membrane protein (TIGR00698 family)
MSNRLKALAPGVIASVIVSLAAIVVGWGEEAVFRRAIVEPLVLAILIGMGVRTLRGERPDEDPGVRFVAKPVLEVAVFLLGATMDVPKLFASGPMLAVGIVLLVISALTIGYSVGRLVGLPHKLAVLVACGNAICGNSAIAAVAPVIEADRQDVAASIALTAVLGVVVVLALPMLMIPLHYSNYQYGVLAGLTVYAVPQVLAAAFAVSQLSGQVATAVKLARVLMLGPVVIAFSILHKRSAEAKAMGKRPSPVPAFVIGFIVLATLRSLHFIPDNAAAGAKLIAGWLTIGAMAALGLGVDLQSVRKVGGKVIGAVAGSLVALICLAIVLIRVLAIQ